MKTSAVLALLAGSAAAFVPAQTPSKASTSVAAFDKAVGAQAPLGFWDPLNILEGADQEKFDRLRYVELKHGRIAMLAFLGQITTRAGFHWSHIPADAPNGAAALFGPNALPAGDLWMIIFFVGFLELGVMSDFTGTGEFPGDFRNGVKHANIFAWDNYTPEQKAKKQAVELNNGRAAQMGILGMMMHEQIGGSFPIIGQM